MRLPRSRAWALLVIAMAATIVLDFSTGPQFSLVAFYLAIACFGSWCIGERVGLAVGAISVLVQLAVHSVNGPASTITAAALAWNMVGRAISMTVLVALASGLRRSLDQARWSAATDALTGVLNKAAFQHRLAAQISQAQRRGDALLMAYFDLDGFKRVNDDFGHAAGDRLLSTFAEQASQAIRAHDLFARVGGDEFVALMTVPTCYQGDVAAERLHHRMSQILRETGYAVTCSMGAMVVESRSIRSAEALVEAADGLMYEVKRSGKNALRVARLDLQPAYQESPTPISGRRAGKAPMADAA
ncbi:GGDEF domain-containing protein [Sphingomonas abietis]|uniref:diguanylate cyclase n=1 Tax=Sphingomonas abietis TaxID=3012344 RepID=A0ABY7NVG3_9SPHN|nr:GGDEF domain-containing protein [Sphingomonas abietis]WBO23436.1 GGDEF domain-containing protein [Sphingomonas abietis]